ncbi:plasmid transfer protein TraA [Streptomyces cucumeris]|uniref:plasmid transfer protein TraA n=1 Tax=Streptomyces cucumeris TaxID=2962890 RepID=UPI003D740F9E
MSTPSTPRNGRSVPPRPTTPPRVPGPGPARAPRPADRTPKFNIEKLNLVPDISGIVPPLTFNYSRTTVVNGGGRGGSAKAKGLTGAPGGDFLNNEDIRAYCEWSRKQARDRSVATAMDVDMLEARLKSIPDVTGSMSGARARAKRVVRWGRRIAQAEKLIAKWYAALYGAFEREYEAELVKIGRGRRGPYQHGKPQPAPFGWR